MRPDSISMTWWTRASILTADTARDLLGIIARHLPDLLPRDWGAFPPYRVHASATEFSAVADLWERFAHGESVCLMGYKSEKRKDVSYFGVYLLCGKTNKTHLLNFEFDKARWGSDQVREGSLAVFSEISAALRADFGRMSLKEEWVAKNVWQQFPTPDGGVNPWKVFCSNVVEGMPGVYWATYIGQAFAEWIGEEKVAEVPWPRVERVGSGYLMVRSASPETWRDEGARDRAVKEHLGEERFFDIADHTRPVERPYLPIPEPYAAQEARRALTADASDEPGDAVRSEAEQLATEPIEPNKPVVDAVRYFRQLGFFKSYELLSAEVLAAAIESLHEQEWGSALEPEGEQFDLELLRWDKERTWWEDTEADVGPGNEAYVQALQGWAKISRGAFAPGDLHEDWGSPQQVVVSFTVGGKRHQLHPRCGDDFLDMAVLSAINRLIESSDIRFAMYAPFDQTAFVVALTEAERQRLEKERGWRFAELLAAG